MTIRSRLAELWNSEDPLDSLWRMFASPYLTMLLLASLALLICLGIVLPQRPAAAITDQVANSLWLASLRERYKGIANWLIRLGLLDVYRSLWLRGLLGLLAFNLLLGTVELIGPRHPRHAGFSRELLISKVAFVESPDLLMERIRSFLHGQRYRFLMGKDYRLACADCFWFFPLLVYLGLLLVIGGLALSERTAWWEDKVTFRPGQIRPLGHGTNIAIRADAIEVAYDSATGRGNKGHTLLTFLHAEGEVGQKTLNSHRPSFYGGLLFYQTSIEPVLLVQARDATGRPLSLRTPETGAGQFTEVALHFSEGDSPRYFVVLDLMSGNQLNRQFQQSGYERYVLVPGRDLSLRLRYNPARPGETAPTFLVEAFRGIETLPFYQHQFHAAETVEIAGDRYSFQPQRYAVIKFGQDCGMGFILLGAVLVLLGIALSVRYPLKRIWLATQPVSGAVNLYLIARAPATGRVPPWFENLVQDVTAVLNVQDKVGRNRPTRDGRI